MSQLNSLSSGDEPLLRSRNTTTSIIPNDKPPRIVKQASPYYSPRHSSLIRVKNWCIKWEVARKLLHTSIGFITLHQWIRGTTSPTKVSSYLSKALIVIISADLLRFRSIRFARFYESILGFLMRPCERNSWNGVIFYLIGVITSLTTLPLDISVLSILILSWVDTAASIVGRKYGSEGNRLPSPPFARRKSLAGFLGALTMGTCTAFTFWWMLGSLGVPGAEGYSWKNIKSSNHLLINSNHLDHNSWISRIAHKLQLPNPRSNLHIAPLSFGCGLVAALAESFDLFGWDDNLVLPILSGWGIWGIMKLF